MTAKSADKNIYRSAQHSDTTAMGSRGTDRRLLLYTAYKHVNKLTYNFFTDLTLFTVIMTYSVLTSYTLLVVRQLAFRCSPLEAQKTQRTRPGVDTAMSQVARPRPNCWP